MKKFIIALAVAVLSITSSLFAELKPGETKVEIKDYKKAIEVYVKFSFTLADEYSITEHNYLRANDENFIKIRNAILVTVDEHFYNLDPKLIEKTVYSSGSGKLLVAR
jgi:hypothetical protein